MSGALKRVTGLHPAYRDDIGDLVTRRPLPGPRVAQVDPFLFLNHHGPQTYPPGNRGLPFGPHPHRGFETVTFILEGELAHADSAGHQSVIGAGGVQWMTAGSGVVHAELSPDSFKRAGGPLEILQLWVNLPGRLKMTPPRYVGLQAPDIPVAEAEGVRTAVVSGRLGGVTGPVTSVTEVTLGVTRIAPGATARFDGAEGRNVFLYLVGGALRVCGADAPEHALATLSLDGDEVELANRGEGEAVALFGHAAPLGEPVVVHGPFVMNTREEIAQAVADYQAGRFAGL